MQYIEPIYYVGTHNDREKILPVRSVEGSKLALGSLAKHYPSIQICLKIKWSEKVANSFSTLPLKKIRNRAESQLVGEGGSWDFIWSFTKE